MEFARWHASHFAWKIGATSLVNVGTPSSAANAAPGASTTSAATAANTPRILASMEYVLSSRPPDHRRPPSDSL